MPKDWGLLQPHVSSSKARGANNVIFHFPLVICHFPFRAFCFEPQRAQRTQRKAQRMFWNRLECAILSNGGIYHDCLRYLFFLKPLCVPLRPLCPLRFKKLYFVRSISHWRRIVHGTKIVMSSRMPPF